MTYSKVQFIAYRIYTGPGHNPDRYVGLSDEAADVRQRVKLMTEALNAAGARSEVDRRSDVLKVFIAPEFYFRSMYGGYTDMKYFDGEGVGRDPNSIVGGLANAVKDERWKDWLFVFGTSVVVAGPFISPDTSNPDLSRKIAVIGMSGPILVFGAEGQVGREVMAFAKARGIEIAGCNRAQADITNFSAVEAAIFSVKPRIVLNAAAYTAVDRAETEPEAAYVANVVGAELVARAAAEQRLPIIHISTDYVFDGTKIGAYVETDPIAPLGVYGTTKAEGETRVREKNPRHFILRTAWVYGRFGANFLKTILRLSREREELRIVADQYGCPTATQDLAEAIFAIDRAWTDGGSAIGTYHFAGTGVTTWHGFASVIVEAQARVGGPHPKVTAISTADYPTPARRPANSALNSNLFGTVFGYRAPAWQARAQEMVEMLHKDSRVET